MTVTMSTGPGPYVSQAPQGQTTTPPPTSPSTGNGVAADTFIAHHNGDLLAALKAAKSLDMSAADRYSLIQGLVEHFDPARFSGGFVNRLLAFVEVGKVLRDLRIGKTTIEQLLNRVKARVETVKKKNKRGLFGGLFKKIGKAVGNAFKKIGNFLLKFGPIIFGVMCLIPGLNVIGMVGLAAIAAYKAIKQGDILGAVLTIAGAVTGGAAGALGSAASAAMQVASKVAQYARMAQQAWKAVQAAQNGNWLGAIAGMASAVAGGVGSGAEKVAETLAKVSAWAKRAETAARAWKTAKNGDVFGAIGIGASLAADISENDQLSQVFDKVSVGARGVKGVQSALEGGDYLAAATLLTQTGSELTSGEEREILAKLSASTRAVSVAANAIDGRDWATAGASLAAASGLWVGSEDTKDLLLTSARGLDLSGRAYRSAERGNWSNAASMLGEAIELLGGFEAVEQWGADEARFAEQNGQGGSFAEAA